MTSQFWQLNRPPWRHELHTKMCPLSSITLPWWQWRHTLFSSQVSCKVVLDHYNIKAVFLCIGIPFIKIRRSYSRLIFIMGIFELVRAQFDIETFQGSPIRHIPRYNVTKWIYFPRYRHFVGESTGHRCFPSQSPVPRSFGVFFDAPEQTVEQTIDTPVIWDAIALIMTSL